MAYVYILRNGNENLFKIGRTRVDVDSRSRQFVTGNPHPLTEFDVIETENDSVCETYLKAILRSKRCLGGRAREWFAVTPEEMRAAIADTRRFDDENVPTGQEAGRLAKEESDGVLLTPSDAEWSIYRSLLDTRQHEDRFHYRRLLLEDRLKLAIGKADGFDGIATWQSEIREILDQVALRSAEPGIFQRYVRITRMRVFRY